MHEDDYSYYSEKNKKNEKEMNLLGNKTIKLIDHNTIITNKHSELLHPGVLRENIIQRLYIQYVFCECCQES